MMQRIILALLVSFLFASSVSAVKTTKLRADSDKAATNSSFRNLRSTIGYKKKEAFNDGDKEKEWKEVYPGKVKKKETFYYSDKEKERKAIYPGKGKGASGSKWTKGEGGEGKGSKDAKTYHPYDNKRVKGGGKKGKGLSGKHGGNGKGSSKKGSKGKRKGSTPVRRYPSIPPASYCMWAPRRGCYTNGWPSCCSVPATCSQVQPDCELPGAPSYCTYSPENGCYKGGWPTCCLNASETCPQEKQACDTKAPTPSSPVSQGPTRPPTPSPTPSPTPPPTPTPTPPTTSPPTPRPTPPPISPIPTTSSPVNQGPPAMMPSPTTPTTPPTPPPTKDKGGEGEWGKDAKTHHTHERKKRVKQKGKGGGKKGKGRSPKYGGKGKGSSSKTGSKGKRKGSTTVRRYPSLPPPSYCMWAPRRGCYTNGWPSCCSVPATCPQVQPGCEWPGAPSFCTYSPDYGCYTGGWPSCCLNATEACPQKIPACDSKAPTPSPPVSKGPTPLPTPPPTRPPTPPPTPTPTLPTTSPPTPLPTPSPLVSKGPTPPPTPSPTPPPTRPPTRPPTPTPTLPTISPPTPLPTPPPISPSPLMSAAPTTSSPVNQGPQAMMPSPTTPPTPPPTAGTARTQTSPLTPDSIVYGLQPSCNSDDSGKYNVCLDLVSLNGTYQNWMEAYGKAKQRWESIIIGDLPSTPSSSLNRFSKQKLTCTNFPSTIDDAYICGQEAVIDGPGNGLVNILGSAAPTTVKGSGEINNRTGKEYQITLTGRMKFDTYDINVLESSGKLEAVILHEMGHVLGIGSLWVLNGLYSTSSGVYKTETHADQEWKAMGCSGPLPVELDGGTGTENGHWDEECLVSELMTGYLRNASSLLLSKITIGSLEDMGYKVDYNQADPFTIADLGQCGPSCPAAAGGRRLQTNERRVQAILGAEEMDIIMSYAKTELTELREALLEINSESDDGIEEAREIFVVYETDGKLYDFHVTWDEVKDLNI